MDRGGGVGPGESKRARCIDYYSIVFAMLLPLASVLQNAILISIRRHREWTHETYHRANQLIPPLPIETAVRDVEYN